MIDRGAWKAVLKRDISNNATNVGSNPVLSVKKTEQTTSYSRKELLYRDKKQKWGTVGARLNEFETALYKASSIYCCKAQIQNIVSCHNLSLCLVD